MTKDRLEQIAKQFFANWCIFRREDGWTLGNDLPSAKMSPYLVHSWEGLDDSGQDWFRAQAALVLHAAKEDVSSGLVTEVAVGEIDAPRALRKLRSALSALHELKTTRAEIKIRSAIRLLTPKA